MPWLLLGARFGLDGSGCVFLLFTAVLWLVAGLALSLIWLRPAWTQALIGRIPPGDLLGPMSSPSKVLTR